MLTKLVLYRFIAIMQLLQNMKIVLENMEEEVVALKEAIEREDEDTDSR